MRKKAVRLIDIAEKLGVSKGCVSSALSQDEHSYIKMSEELREKIRAAAKEMNYRPNLLARTLAGRRSKILGVLLDPMSPNVTLRLISEIEKQAGEHGCRILIGEIHGDMESILSAYSTLKCYGVDGVIILSHNYPGLQDSIDRAFRNCDDIVFVRGPVHPGHPHVFPGMREGVCKLTKHLLKHSSRVTFLYCGQENEDAFQSDRLLGFLDALPDGTGMPKGDFSDC